MRLRHRIGVGSGAGHHVDSATSLDQFVQRCAVNCQIADNREGSRAEGLQLEVSDLGKSPKMLTAGRGVRHRAVRLAIHQEATAATHTLTTIGLEDNGLAALFDNLIVEAVEQLQHAHLGLCVVDDVMLETTLGARTCLAPDIQCDLHR